MIRFYKLANSDFLHPLVHLLPFPGTCLFINEISRARWMTLPQNHAAINDNPPCARVCTSDLPADLPDPRWPRQRRWPTERGRWAEVNIMSSAIAGVSGYGELRFFFFCLPFLPSHPRKIRDSTEPALPFAIHRSFQRSPFPPFVGKLPRVT